MKYLNQAHAGLWLVRTLFLKIISVRMSVCVCLCVCVSAPRLLITRGVMWHDMDPMQLVKQVLQLLYGNCYMATVVVIVKGGGLGVGTCHRH